MYQGDHSKEAEPNVDGQECHLVEGVQRQQAQGRYPIEAGAWTVQEKTWMMKKLGQQITYVSCAMIILVKLSNKEIAFHKAF